MNRNEWKQLYSGIRHDARTFKERHGGFPCFIRGFQHNGVEWCLTRVRMDGINWHTRLRPALIRQQPWQGRHAYDLNECADYRAEYRRGRRVSAKAMIRLNIHEARLRRIAATA